MATKKRGRSGTPRSFDMDPSRVIMITDTIDWDSVKEVGFMLARYADAPLPVMVRIGSPGGMLSAGLAIYDMLRSSQMPIVTEAVGLAASSASLIFEAGHVRLMGVNARILIHEGSLEIEQAKLDAGDTRNLLAELTNRNRHITMMLAKRTGNSIKQIREWMQQSKTFTARLAVRHGFADGISAHFSAQDTFAKASAFLAAMAETERTE